MLRAARAGSGAMLSRASPRQPERRMSRLSPLPMSAGRQMTRDAPGPRTPPFPAACRPEHMRQHLPSVRQISAGAGSQEGRSIFEHDEDDGEFEQAMQQLMQEDASRQVAGAKRLSALLKPQTLLDDAPVEIARPDAAEEARLAQLRQAWSTAVHDSESADHEHARAEGLTKEEEEDGMLLSALDFGDLSFDMVAEALAAVDALGLLPRRGGVVSGGTMVDFTARGGQFALAAALLHPFDYVLGVEGSEDKCAEARGRLDSLQNLLSHVVGDDDRLTHEVSFEHSADSTDKEVEENGLLAADFVAINCAGLNEFQVNDLGEALLGLRRNAVIICFGRRAPCPGALLLDTRMLSCQWDDFPCYILQRIGDGHNAHLPPVELGTEAMPRLVNLMGGAAAVAAVRGHTSSPALQAAAEAKADAGGGAGAVGGGVATAADVRQLATMTLSYCAHSERNARLLVGEEHLVVERLVALLQSSRALSKTGQPSLAAAAAAVMLLRALGKHPCALPAIVDTPGCVDALVAMLSLDNLAVAAGAADALSLCLEFVEAKAVLVQAGVVPGLQGLKRRAAASQHKQALETAELVLALIGQDALDTAVGMKSPLYEHLKGLGLDKGLPSKKIN